MTEHFKRVLQDCGTVYTVVQANGDDHAATFLLGLEARFRSRYQRYFEYLRDGHNIKSPENCRHLRTDGRFAVYELKVDAWRLYAVKYQGIWYLTHGRRKPKDNQVPKEIDRAIDILNEQLH